MYNRYIPQPDGSYRRNRMPDQHGRPQPPPPPRPPFDKPHKEEPVPPLKPVIEAHPPVTGFLKQLLPKNLDTGDLIIILLLLLIAGDCEESRNNALLTLALYFLL